MCFSQSENYIQDIFNPKQKIQLYKFASLIWNKMHFIELNLTYFYMIFKVFFKNQRFYFEANFKGKNQF